jgi:hypothetical protein
VFLFLFLNHSPISKSDFPDGGGIEKMKPNHHFLVHLPAQIDYGQVYGFWCFLGARLNKLLKSFKSNNWGGGQLEVSMMCE